LFDRTVLIVRREPVSQREASRRSSLKMLSPKSLLGRVWLLASNTPFPVVTYPPRCCPRPERRRPPKCTKAPFGVVLYTLNLSLYIGAL